MNATITVSVIVPSHNHGAYLEAALRSVLAQSGVLLELIVVDDGSTDDTPALLRRWQARGAHCVRQPQRGVAAARNQGLALAQGEFIAFLDADDFWPANDVLAKAVAHMRAQPKICWTFGDAQPFVQLGEDLCPQGLPYLLAGGLYTAGDPAARPWPLRVADLCSNDRFFIPTGSLLIRKRCFDEVGGFDEGLAMFEDTDMWLRLRHYPLAFFPRVLMWRREHAGNISQRRWAHLEDLRTLFARHNLAAEGVSFDFHAARAHFGVGRAAWQQGQYAEAARAFAASWRHRRGLKSSLLYAAATLADGLHLGGRQDA